MEKSHTVDKENLFGAINCSPILSSGSVLRENRTQKFEYSPLSEQKSACQDNRLSLPGTHTTAKLGLFLSTPVRQAPDPLPCTWEEIRKLDEEELWIERTQVVTKEDHILYCELAKEIVNNVIENLPILNMDENNAECNNTVVAADIMKDDLPNGLIDAGNPGEIEAVCKGNAADVVCEERKEDMTTDMKDLVLNNDNVHLSDQHNLEKSGMEEDNDFIYSCSDLDTTVKEVSANEDTVLENTIIFPSEDKDVSDLDETVKNVSADEQASSANTLPDNNLDPELVDDFNSQFDEVDEGAFKPSAVFGLELDFLESCGNSSGMDHISDLARQSLYVKFDPLVEARKPDLDSGGLLNINPADLLFKGPLAADDLLGMDTPPEKPVVSRRALLAQTQNTEAGESTATSVVAPVDLFALSPSQNVDTTEKELEEGASKSESSIVVEREEESSLVQPLQFSKNDLEKAVEKTVEEEKEKLLSQWNLQNSLHEAEMEKLLGERNKILEERNKIIDENKVVKTLMMEYEQTMAQMIKDRESEQSQQEKSNSEIVQERDQLQRDLNNTEKSFAHLHEKFGKLKIAVESYRKNEEVLKKVVKDLQEDVKNAEAKYQVLKNHAEQKLQEANVEINRVQTTYKTELAGLQAAFKREKSKNSSLQQSLDQKVNENKELTAICDELISKVGPMP